jgi:hypothetical protein
MGEHDARRQSGGASEQAAPGARLRKMASTFNQRAECQSGERWTQYDYRANLRRRKAVVWGCNMAFQKTGTVSFDLKPLADDILNDDEQHKIGQINVGDDLSISLFKTAERRLEVRATFGHSNHTFAGPMPSIPPSGVPMAVTWNEHTVALLVNGKAVMKAPFEPTKH